MITGASSQIISIHVTTTELILICNLFCDFFFTIYVNLHFHNNNLILTDDTFFSYCLDQLIHIFTWLLEIIFKKMLTVYMYLL